jgi:hypothetical protein
VEIATDKCGNTNEKPWEIWSYVIVHNIIRENESNVFLPFSYYYRRFVPTTPIDTSGETSFSQEVNVERDGVWWFLLVLYKLNLGSYNPRTKYHQKMVLLLGLGFCN